MLHYFKNISIKAKIVAIVMIISAVSLILSGIVFSIYDKAEFRLKSMNSLNILAEVIGTNNTASLLFDDTNSANQSLKAVGADKHICQVTLFNKEGKKIASYRNDSSDNSMIIVEGIKKDTSFFTKKNLVVAKLINYDQEVIGMVYISSDLKEYSERVTRLVKIMVILLIISLLASLYLSLKMQKIISEPVLNLSDFMRRVSKNKDYSLRIENDRKDEIGNLIDCFNLMLMKIQLQNQDIIDAREEAINMAKVKEQFLANMSHEIRTPMNAIIGLSDLLLDTRLDSDQKGYMRNISMSSENLLVIINDILDFSKIESGMLDFEKIEFNLHDLLKNIMNTFQFKAKEKDIFAKLELDEQLPEIIVGDPVRLNQILINLVGNALKFTEKGGVFLKVERLAEKKGKQGFRMIRFSVSDTGVGIQNDMLNNIFKDFCQASSSTTRKYGGSGLGLTITKRLVEMQNGSISVTSVEGKGSCFVATIPYIMAVERCIQPQKDKEIVTYCEITGKLMDIDQENIGIRILVVEDNKINQLLAKSLLQKRNFIVDVVDNGSFAIEKLKTEDYDIILMDLHMPEMDGMEATEYIRTKMVAPKCMIPIIALTAAAIKGERAKCLEAGMNDYVSKPFKAEELLTKIRKFIIPPINNPFAIS